MTVEIARLSARRLLACVLTLFLPSCQNVSDIEKSHNPWHNTTGYDYVGDLLVKLEFGGDAHKHRAIIASVVGEETGDYYFYISSLIPWDHFMSGSSTLRIQDQIAEELARSGQECVIVSGFFTEGTQSDRRRTTLIPVSVVPTHCDSKQ